MSGVDRLDKMISYYTEVLEKLVNGYKKVIFHLLDVTVWNSFYVYRNK